MPENLYCQGLRVNSPEFREGYDRTFGKKKEACLGCYAEGVELYSIVLPGGATVMGCYKCLESHIRNSRLRKHGWPPTIDDVEETVRQVAEAMKTGKYDPDRVSRETFGNVSITGPEETLDGLRKIMSEVSPEALKGIKPWFGREYKEDEEQATPNGLGPDINLEDTEKAIQDFEQRHKDTGHL